MPKLQHFNEALVDHFCPEKAVASITNPNAWFGIKHFIHSYKQKKDFKKALIHAETNILEFIRNPKLRTYLNGQHLEAWIKQLHAIAGKTVLSEFGSPSGHYSHETVVLWKKTNEFAVCFELIVNQCSDNPQQRNELIENLFYELDLKDESKHWITLLSKADKAISNSTISNTPVKSPFSNLFKYIEHAKEKQRLTPEEMTAIEKICRISSPSTIPKKMNVYAKTLAHKIKACDGNF